MSVMRNILPSTHDMTFVWKRAGGRNGAPVGTRATELNERLSDSTRYRRILCALPR